MREGNEAERHRSRLPLTTIVSPFPTLNTHQHKTFKNLLAAVTIIVLILRNLSNRYYYPLFTSEESEVREIK